MACSAMIGHSFDLVLWRQLKKVFSGSLSSGWCLFFKSKTSLEKNVTSYYNHGRRGGLMVSAIASRSSAPRSSPSLNIVLCFWAREFTLTVPPPRWREALYWKVQLLYKLKYNFLLSYEKWLEGFRDTLIFRKFKVVLNLFPHPHPPQCFLASWKLNLGFWLKFDNKNSGHRNRFWVIST